MSSIAIGRLTQERKDWRKGPLPEFYARPSKKADNSNDMMVWEAGITCILFFKPISISLYSISKMTDN